MDNYKWVIELLKSDEYTSLKSNINMLVNDSKFINLIVKIDNPIIFDRFIKMCEFRIDTSAIYEERKKFIKKKLNSLTEDNYCASFGLKNSDKMIANRYIIEYIISYYFQDNYYNFMTNYFIMKSYLSIINEPLVNPNNLSLYKEFIELKTMSLSDEINFFNLLLDTNIMEMFYDDIRTTRTHSHKILVDKTLKLNHNSPIYNKKLSQNLGVDVYYLDGEPFYGFVRVLHLNTNDLSDNEAYVNSKLDRYGYSFTYWGDKNIGTTDYECKSVTLYYDKIDYRNIVYVHHGDCNSNMFKVQEVYLSEKENEITTPSSLVARTNNYNEVFIKEGEDGIIPTALVCYDVIDNYDILFAKKYHLSLLLVNTKKYRRYETYDDEYKDYTYVI